MKMTKNNPNLGANKKVNKLSMCFGILNWKKGRIEWNIIDLCSRIKVKFLPL